MTTTTADSRQPTLTQLARQIEASGDPLSRLAGMRLLRAVLATAEADAVRAAREAGASWGAIGSGIGVSKQAALKRFGERCTPVTPEPVAANKAGTPPTTKKSRMASTGWELTTPGGRTLLRIRPSATDPVRKPD